MARYLQLFLSLVFLLFCAQAVAQDTSSSAAYLDPAIPFNQLESVDEEAQAWAMCAAVYNLVASLYVEIDPAIAEQSLGAANGAVTAIAITYLNDGLENELDNERLAARWDYAVRQSTVLPEFSTNWVLAQREDLETNLWLKQINDTVAVCALNAELQEIYVSAMNELRSAGSTEMEEASP